MTETPSQLTVAVMKLRLLLVNMPVSTSLAANLDFMMGATKDAKKGSVVIFPEGAISGYAPDMQFLKSLTPKAYQASIEKLKQEAHAREIEIWAGSALLESGRWMNAAIGLRPSGGLLTYRKINLANAERGHFHPGDQLPLYPLDGFRDVRVAIQLCRELRFPEQWGFLARKGAKAFFHLNNAVGNASIYDVWRSHLISRAAENQRYVFSVNCASDEQNSPTIAVDPNGMVLVEVRSAKMVCSELEVDLSKSSTDLLDQCRSDVIRIEAAR